MVVLCAALRVELTSRELALISGLIIISNIQYFLEMRGNRKRQTINTASALLGNPVQTGAADGAAAVPVFPAPMSHLGEEQQRLKNGLI